MQHQKMHEMSQYPRPVYMGFARHSGLLRTGTHRYR